MHMRLFDNIIMPSESNKHRYKAFDKIKVYLTPCTPLFLDFGTLLYALVWAPRICHYVICGA